jgi:hypothetical protein
MTVTNVEFRDTSKPLSETLKEVAAGLPSDKTTIQRLMTEIGEQGILLLCIVLMVPFLTPIPVPFISNFFGLIVILLTFGVILNRVPWMPRRFLEREIPTPSLAKALMRGAGVMTRIEKLLRPRLTKLTTVGPVNRMNGIIMLLAAFLFSLPVSFIPGSNTFPALAVVLISAGMLTKDGLFVLLGYVASIGSLIYFALVVLLIVGGVVTVSQLAGGGAAEATATLAPTIIATLTP